MKHKRNGERAVVPSAYDLDLAREVHTQFALKPGARHISSEFALAYLSALVREIKPRRVLEFGAGIGTISSLLLRHSYAIEKVTATESNAFCVEQLQRNIEREHTARFELLKPDAIVNTIKKHFDLVVIDGSVSTSDLKHLGPGTTCFIEGSRRATRREIESAMRKRHLRCSFVNYHRGIKYFHVEHFANDDDTIRSKFYFRRVIKGCWIGRITSQRRSDNQRIFFA